jgi:hypothetical protein
MGNVQKAMVMFMTTNHRQNIHIYFNLSRLKYLTKPKLFSTNLLSAPKRESEERSYALP